MADKKISQLTNITGADVVDSTDELAIVDASVNETKAITREELFKSVGGATFDGNISLGDNDELRFGDSNDLILEHNGSNGDIRNNINDLLIRNLADDRDVRIISDDGSGGTADYFRADGSTGEAKMYYYGAEKLNTKSTGVDVTGGITTSGEIGIGTSSPAGKLHVSDTFPTLILEETDADTDYQQTQLGVDDGGFRIQTRASTNSFVSNDYLIDKDASGATDHIWRISNTEKMRIDSSGVVTVNEGSVVLNGSTISAVQVTIASDAFATITPTGRYGGFLSVVCAGEGVFPQMGLSGYALVDFGDTPLSPAGTQTTGSDFDVYASGPPTGTTGTDGNVGLFLGGTSGSFYIENRRSSSSNFQITLL